MARLLAASLALALLAGACSSDSSTAPTGTTSATALDAVTIAPASTAHPGGTMTMTFNGTMMTGMEQFVDLHRGDITGPVVPMTCALSGDRTAIQCAPGQALTPGAQYTLHMGAGMKGSSGGMVDMSSAMGMGGTWMTSSMGSMHNGSMMGTGWSDGSGHQGMLMPFTAS
jgi:hypothetical protein